MRNAIFQIWLNRDYTLYGQLTQKDMSLENWYPSARMRLYVRKDVVSSIWNYGTAPTPQEVIIDPFEDKQIQLNADRIFGSVGTEPGQFFNPRAIWRSLRMVAFLWPIPGITAFSIWLRMVLC